MIEHFYRSIATMRCKDLALNILMLLCIFILKKAEVESTASGLIKLISPRDVNVFLQEGDPLNIEFRSAVPSSLYRYVNGLRERMDTNTYKISSDQRYYYLRVHKPAITAQDAGQYICITQDRGDGDSEEKSVRVLIAKTTSFDGDLRKEYENVTIRCDVAGITTYKIIWKKDGEVLTDDRYVRNDTDKSITITKANRRDVGKYTCTFVPDPISSGEGNVSATPHVKSIPFIDPFHGSVSPWQGDEVVLDCKVYGFPLPEITWLKESSDSNRVSLANTTKTEFGSYQGMENARLTIRNLEASDRAHYVCVASVDGKDQNRTEEKILVRVKDRYAALWPFIGICAEVIILVVIIFVYEKRKVKSTDDDSDSGAKTNSHDQRAGGDVRQRNTVRT